MTIAIVCGFIISMLAVFGLGYIAGHDAGVRRCYFAANVNSRRLYFALEQCRLRLASFLENAPLNARNAADLQDLHVDLDVELTAAKPMVVKEAATP